MIDIAIKVDAWLQHSDDCNCTSCCDINRCGAVVCSFVFLILIHDDRDAIVIGVGRVTHTHEFLAALFLQGLK